MATFDDLPKDIHLHIFSFFGKKELGCVAQVNKKYLYLASDDLLWKQLIKRELDISFEMDLIKLPKDFSWKEFYCRFIDFLKLPHNNYLQYYSNKKITLSDLELLRFPLKDFDINKYSNKHTNINILKSLHDRPLLTYYEPNYNQNSYSKFHSTMKFTIRHISKSDMSSVEKIKRDSAWKMEIDDLIVISSYLVIATNQADELKKIYQFLVKIKGRNFLPNLIIMTLEKNNEKFISELKSLKINIAAIIPGRLRLEKICFNNNAWENHPDLMDENEKKLLEIIHNLQKIQLNPPSALCGKNSCEEIEEVFELTPSRRCSLI